MIGSKLFSAFFLPLKFRLCIGYCTVFFLPLKFLLNPFLLNICNVNVIAFGSLDPEMSVTVSDILRGKEIEISGPFLCPVLMLAF